jgi:hypothetical protein
MLCVYTVYCILYTYSIEPTQNMKELVSLVKKNFWWVFCYFFYYLSIAYLFD